MSQPVPREWLVGTAWLFAGPVFNTALALKQAGVAENPDCDIEVYEPAFLTVAEDLFAGAAGEMA